MARKIFWLTAKDAASWHSPADVVARLKMVFDHVKENREAARKLGNAFISKYRLLLEAGLGDHNSTPLPVVERRWQDAVVVSAADASDATAPFSVGVRTEDRFELVFPPKTPFHRRRRTAEKVAAALGYDVEHFDPDE